MLWTFLESFSFIPLMASEKIFEYIFFWQIWCLGCHGKQSKSEVWEKFMCNIRDYSKNISVKLCQNISSEIEK